MWIAERRSGQGPSSQEKRPRLRFSERVSVDGGNESPRSLASPAPDYSPDLQLDGEEEVPSPIPNQRREDDVAEHVQDEGSLLSKSERKKKRKEAKLKKLLAEATSTTNEEDTGPGLAAPNPDAQRKEKVALPCPSLPLWTWTREPGQLLGKFNYQLRVEEEVKQALRSFYSNKKIDKDQYKEIMRKTVPKVRNTLCFQSRMLVPCRYARKRERSTPSRSKSSSKPTFTRPWRRSERRNPELKYSSLYRLRLFRFQIRFQLHCSLLKVAPYRITLYFVELLLNRSVSSSIATQAVSNRREKLGK